VEPDELIARLQTVVTANEVALIAARAERYSFVSFTIIPQINFHSFSVNKFKAPISSFP